MNTHRLHGAKTLLLAGLTAGAARAQIGPYPDQYDPSRILRIDLALDPADWDVIRFDLTFEIEVPAMMKVEEEEAILVSVRRKSATALPSELDPQKISMKIDINEYVAGQEWHGVKKLSLENGDDVNVVTEGFAWYLQRLATGFNGSSYQPGLAAWVQVRVNGQDLGVYLNVEQPDKSFLKNRGLWTKGATWQYKQDGVSETELKEGDPHSPAYQALCYSPFQKGGCPRPGDSEFVDELNGLIDMESMMILGALTSFTSNPDAIFSKGKNFYYADFLGAKRTYAPWDLDAAINNMRVDGSIYDTGSGPGKYEELIAKNPSFRPLYDATMQGLLDGPLQEGNLIAFLDQSEALLAGPLAADPNNQLDGEGVGPYFDSLRAWARGRIENVRSQLPPPVGDPGKASDPSPADGATGVGLLSTLSWTAGLDATSHDVYFGTNPSPGAAEFKGNQLGTSFDPGALDPGVTYFWRIDEVGLSGTTVGDVWSFTTQTDTGGLTLSGRSYKLKGQVVVDLAWSGATTATVDILRDGVFLLNVANTGAYTDFTGIKGGGSLTYQVCEPGGACSNIITLQY